MTPIRVLRRRVVWASLLFTSALATACNVGPLNDPSQVQDSDIANANGANMRRLRVLSAMYTAVATSAASGAVLTDELGYDVSPDYLAQAGDPSVFLDERASLSYEAKFTTTDFPNPYADWNTVRFDASLAIQPIRTYLPDSVKSAYLGQVFAVRGLAALQLAEDVCPGFPLNDVVNDQVVFGTPLTTEQVLTQALVDLDSAVVRAADSARILDLARLGRGRALLSLGRYTDAAAAVAPVATSYVLNAEYLNNPIHFGDFVNFSADLSVGDHEGGNGLDFVSAADPRVVTASYGNGFHGGALYTIAKYVDPAAPIVIASGIEARLIEAEAALHAGDVGTWLAKLNELRATAAASAMTSLVDPGTTTARVDLLFRERAFWLFATGRRLGDLRRLVRLYGRAPSTVFPTGAYASGGVYRDATNIPFPASKEKGFNPAVTGCTTR